MSKSASANGRPVRKAPGLVGVPDAPVGCEQPTLPQVQLSQLRWAGWYARDWEILVYERSDVWEACFFKWDIYHEHVIGLSLDDARRKAKEMIDALQS